MAQPLKHPLFYADKTEGDWRIELGQSVKQFIAEIDGLIRGGKMRDARQRLAKIEPEKTPRAAILPLAILARRSNLPHLALKLLHPVVRRPVEPEATIAEKGEYAASLSFIGAGPEAYQLLEELDPSGCPEILLYRSFALFSVWNYKASIAYLEKYTSVPDLDPYKRLVGKLNLAAAMVNERLLPPADALLNELANATEKENLRLLRGNIFELQAQVAMLRGFYATAEKHLFGAEEHLKDTGGLYSLFARKWRAVVKLKSDESEQGRAEGLKMLKLIRLEAVKRCHWETVRDCDRHEAFARKDKELFFQVFFGTPYEGYRRRLLKEFPGELKVPSHYFLKFKQHFEPKTFVDVTTGEINRKISGDPVPKIVASLGDDPELLRTFQCLAKDFYAPIRLPSLFSSVFTGEYYVPGKSSAKAYRMVQKLRTWFESKKLPFQINESQSFYSVTANETVALKITSGNTTDTVAYRAA